MPLPPGPKRRNRSSACAKIARLMRGHVYVVASQGVMQVVIIVIMAKFAAGL